MAPGYRLSNYRRNGGIVMERKNPASKADRASVSIGPDAMPDSSNSSKKPWLSMLSPINHEVHITSDNGAFLVAILPPNPDFPPQLFTDYRRARGFAGGIRMVRRWPIRDETGGVK